MQLSAVQPAGRPIVARAWLFSRMKKHFRVIFSDFGRIPCDFRLDIRNFGKKCEIKGNKEKSRGSGQGLREIAMGGWQVWIARYNPIGLSSASIDYGSYIKI